MGQRIYDWDMSILIIGDEIPAFAALRLLLIKEGKLDVNIYQTTRNCSAQVFQRL